MAKRGAISEADRVRSMAQIALTEHQIAYVLGEDVERIQEVYGDMIEDEQPRDYKRRRWVRFAKHDARAASAARRYLRKTYGRKPYEIVRASLTSQMRERYFRSMGKSFSRPWTFLPYTPHDLVRHLEAAFTAEMSWDNYGTWWEIDHKKPASWFDVKCLGDSDFQKCWAIDNLQPLQKSSNRTKGNRWCHG